MTKRNIKMIMKAFLMVNTDLLYPGMALARFTLNTAVRSKKKQVGDVWKMLHSEKKINDWSTLM